MQMNVLLAAATIFSRVSAAAALDQLAVAGLVGAVHVQRQIAAGVQVQHRDVCFFRRSAVAFESPPRRRSGERVDEVVMVDRCRPTTQPDRMLDCRQRRGLFISSWVIRPRLVTEGLRE